MTTGVRLRCLAADRSATARATPAALARLLCNSCNSNSSISCSIRRAQPEPEPEPLATNNQSIPPAVTAAIATSNQL